MVGPEGLEPPTLCFEGRCSIQLSYGPVEKFITTRDSRVLYTHSCLCSRTPSEIQSVWPRVTCVSWWPNISAAVFADVPQSSLAW